MRYSLVAYGDNKNNYVECVTTDKLEDIVAFTNSFENKYDLLKHLMMRKGNNVFSNKFGVILFKNSQTIHLRDGISFKKDDNIFKVQELLGNYERLMDNPAFVKLFLERYYRYLKERSCFSLLLETIKGYSNIENPTNEQKEITKDSIIEFVKQKIKYNTKNVSFTDIRDLAMLVISFRRDDNEEIFSDNSDYLIDEINKLQSLIDNLYSIIENGATDEEIETHKDTIEKLELKIKEYRNELDINNTIRRINNGENTKYQNTRRIPQNT